MKSLMDLVEAIELKPFADLGYAESERVLAIRNEPEVRRNMYTDHEIGIQEHREWLARTNSRGDVKMFAVVFDGQIVGAIGLTSIVPAQLRAEWAFYLSAATQGRGLGSRLSGFCIRNGTPGRCSAGLCRTCQQYSRPQRGGRGLNYR